jgi:3-methyladenine DNA glycosylase AlkC
MTTVLALLKTKFDVSLKDFKNRLANYHFRLEQNDLQIKKMAKSLQVSLQQVIESSKVSIQDTMEAQKDIFQRKLTHMMDNNVKDFKSMLRGACNTYETEIQRREQIFYGNLEGIADKVMEKTHRELYTTAEDALATLNNQIGEVTTQLMDNINHTTSTVEPPVATTVPDVPQSGSNASRWNIDPQYRDHLKNLKPSQPPMFDPAGTRQKPALPNQIPSVIGGMPANMMYQPHVRRHSPSKHSTHSFTLNYLLVV